MIVIAETAVWILLIVAKTNQNKNIISLGQEILISEMNLWLY